MDILLMLCDVLINSQPIIRIIIHLVWMILNTELDQPKKFLYYNLINFEDPSKLLQ